MSDTNWVSPSEHETGQYNDNFDQGRPPDSGFEKGNTEKRTDPPDPEGLSQEWKVTTFFKGTKTAQGTEDVFEQCDRCAGHDHKLITARGRAVTNPPVYAQEHCGTERFGDRSGQLSRFHVKGQEIRRLEITLIFADGSRAVPQIDWEQRLVDHDDGEFTWHGSMSCTPCLSTGLAFKDSARVDTIMMKALSSAGALREVAAILDHGQIGAMIRTASAAKHPGFEISLQGPNINAALSDRTAKGLQKLIGNLTFSRDAKRGQLRVLAWRPQLRRADAQPKKRKPGNRRTRS